MAHEVECLHKDKIYNMDKKLDKLLELINGNGKVGLGAKVCMIWNIGTFVCIAVAGLVVERIIHVLF